MEDFGLYQHSLRKKQTREIIRKIDAKNYYQMKKNRSEGLEVAADYTQQLRHAVRRSKTEKLTFLQRSSLRKRLMTEYSIPQPLQKDGPKISNAFFEVNSQQLHIKDWKEPQTYQRAQPSSQNSIGCKFSADLDKIDFQGEQYKNQQLSSIQKEQQLSQRTELHEISQKQQPLLVQSKDKKKFLPMLELYIQEQNSLKSMNVHEKQIRNLVVTMMVLAINRRSNGRLLDALDVLLQTEVYFPKQNKEMTRLKAVWLELIGKIYQEIKKSFKSNKGASRWKKTTRKSSIKTSLAVKRQKTIFIRSLSSRKAFYDKFSQNLRKSMLVYESSYMNELRNELNGIKYDEGRRILSKMNKDFTISYPQPSSLYPSCENIQNYAIIMISKDKQANIFPLNYPESLAGFVSSQQHINKIIKINSFLIPYTKCMDYSSSLYINFQLLFCIFLIILVVAVSLILSTSRIAIFLVLAVAVCLISIASFKIHSRSKEKLHQMGQVNQYLDKCCKQWEQQYQNLDIKFILSSKLDVLLISFPIDQEVFSEEDNTENAQENDSGQNLMKQITRKCSIRLREQTFENPLDEINQDSSDDNELDAQFWQNIQDKVDLQELQQNFQAQFSQESQDEIMKIQSESVKTIEVQLLQIDNQFSPDFQ